MAAYASAGDFHAQACYHCSQAAEKALKAVLLALDQEPERTHSIERWLSALELLRIETTPLRQLPLLIGSQDQGLLSGHVVNRQIGIKDVGHVAAHAGQLIAPSMNKCRFCLQCVQGSASVEAA